MIAACAGVVRQRLLVADQVQRTCPARRDVRSDGDAGVGVVLVWLLGLEPCLLESDDVGVRKLNDLLRLLEADAAERAAALGVERKDAQAPGLAVPCAGKVRQQSRKN